MPSVRRLSSLHRLLYTGPNWETDDGRFTIESEELETECDGRSSRSGYCPAHGDACKGVAFYTAWTVWDVEKQDHIDGNPFPYYSFGDALGRLKGEYQ